ncbi:hypothetical protein SS50377_26703 [Spironucleus salmonicida]|uniref:Uncharacterized protein n=1 Tax=Spironucleus salmonicida TaxID=348837 RepID=V6LZL3_9EUKA|nr:hypothetical protein SS50377_26703 [Spironucleus salmonicida]|eukprot:EST49176.1 Hypothetical protein SS50377_10390 [Spironucleus salmonicida]
MKKENEISAEQLILSLYDSPKLIPNKESLSSFCSKTPQLRLSQFLNTAENLQIKLGNKFQQVNIQNTKQPALFFHKANGLSNYSTTPNLSRIEILQKTFLEKLCDALIQVKFPNEPEFEYFQVQEVFIEFSEKWFAFKQLYGYKSLLSLAHHFSVAKNLKSQLFDKFSPSQYHKDCSFKQDKSIIRHPDVVVKSVHRKQFQIFLELHQNVDYEKILMKKRREKVKQQKEHERKLKDKSSEEQRYLRRRVTRLGLNK